MEEKETSEEQKDQNEMPAKGNSMVWIAVVAAAIIGIILFSRGGNKDSATLSQGTPTDAPKESSADNQSVKSFDVSAKPFEFSIKEIKVKKGDRVRINLAVTLGMHDWVIEEFNARTKVVQTGQSDSIEFVADKIGTFEYYCSVPTHRQQGMVGKLIVE
ncbi:MAG: hypothetical protein A2359_03465 [Candidatus Moranbacteria bacterium RIFOXYB1_FULL_43_19]|nr:MAG: hypothetical protein A2359_03465 [Candidatus Moranbacteria bacterium RIFOXYB1_FULL_43_19]OGI27914.1 MAG: hypothetical protein A2184_02775 [Candidatus Moranbacteria bacterium RIFOXYA1_FULL_44_7]OGI32530.1 MAG: hypothetical protein A2420_03070 [Candidatus Moranbacteria bacterium RIFOXYC1_FULL_44_13]OGI38152.1 MAG: hypothetical protein A2612_01360 [Candidatus Moranbacteria bacterium RIFOXYD1_FULL_44_12]